MDFSGKTLYEDLFGLAIWDYVRGEPEDIITWTSLTPPEILRVDYLFRTYDAMPAHEKIALEMASGKILDVGAGSGVHSIHLQNIGKRVTALERSEYACMAMEAQGVRDIRKADFFRFSPGEKFDTILLLMNGGGIMGTLDRAEDFFLKLRLLLADDGQVLIHMSDISYVYYAYDKPLPLHKYYGEVMFYLKYKNRCGEPFPWLYFDTETFRRVAGAYGFASEIIKYDAEGDVLVKAVKI
jgi:SAM-dependent methyltransferase